jgi:MinD-like ATPase involved in chromosome partitioning or flagellar assembly|tara:strand:+ start:191 stop:469 length:279 start_codon:yes stop_codon:yes gene_type:complete
MYIRIVNLKFASEIEADAMQAYAEHELINKLPGILSIEVVRVTNLHSVVINKFQSQKHAEESKDIIINKMKQNPNIKIEIFEGERLFIKEKS